MFVNACKLRVEGIEKVTSLHQCIQVMRLCFGTNPSDLLNCDLPGSMPCPLNEHVHWNTGWGLASTIWTNTNTEEF